MAGLNRDSSYSDRYIKPHQRSSPKAPLPPPKLHTNAGNVYTSSVSPSQVRGATFSGPSDHRTSRQRRPPSNHVSNTPPPPPAKSRPLSGTKLPPPVPTSTKPHPLAPPTTKPVPERPMHKLPPALPTKADPSAVAPPVPPKRESSTGNRLSISSSSSRHSYSLKVSDHGSIYRLAEFVVIFGPLLPLRVKITEGYCGKDEQSVISAGDMYNFHFIKNEKVVSFRLGEGKKALSLPLNTSIQFGPLYNPTGDTTRAVKGYTFRTVSDLVACKVLPHLVRATRSCNSGESVSSVQAEDILLITGIERTSILSRKSCIKALCMNTRQSKTLFGECEGCFVTDPASVRLFPTDIAEHLKDKLPLKAILFPDSSMSEDSFEHLASEVVTLSGINVETSIIASSCTSDSHTGRSDEDEEVIPVAIPTNLKISLTILDEEGEDEDLYADTRDLIDNFNPYNVQSMAASSDTDSATGVYMSLKQLVRSGHEYQGLEIVKPSKIYSDDSVYEMPGSNYEDMYMEAPSPIVSQPSSQHDPPSIPSEPNLPTSHETEPDTRGLTDLNTRNLNTSDGCTVQTETTPGKSLECEVEELKAQLRQAVATIAELKVNYSSLSKELTKVKKRVESIEKPSSYEEVSPHSVERNVEELKHLTCEQVQMLLKKMNLDCYLELFRTEEIDGSLLSECDESILQHELAITNSLHQRRLMKIITGKQSARQYL